MDAKTRLGLLIIVFVLNLIGWYLLISTNWKIAVGIFLILWSNNIVQKINQS